MGGLPILAETHVIMPIVEQAIRDNEGYATRFGVHLTLGESADDAEVVVDSLRLVQVLSNLLVNGVQEKQSCLLDKL